MKVEKASFDDIDELRDLRLAYLNADSGPLDEKDADMIHNTLPDYFRSHLNRDLFAYVVRSDGQIVSCAFLLVIEKPMSPAFINGMTATVLNVYTCPDFRHRGCARKIMQKLLADAEEMKVSVIELKATADGYPLYRSLGFADNHGKYQQMEWKNPLFSNK